MFVYTLIFLLCFSHTCWSIEETGCETSTIQLQCPEGQVIVPENVTYGPDTNGTCPPNREINRTADYCFSADNTQTVEYLCGGQNNCSLTITIQYFENPCPNDTKILHVSYQCVNESDYVSPQQNTPCPDLDSGFCEENCPDQCERTCERPSPGFLCFAVKPLCRKRCYCNRGKLRNPLTNRCVERYDCPSDRSIRFG